MKSDKSLCAEIAELRAERDAALAMLEDEYVRGRLAALEWAMATLERKGNATGEAFRSKAFFDAADVIQAEIDKVSK